MKIITGLALVAALAGCEQQPSKLDSSSDAKAMANAKGSTTPTAPGATTPAAAKVDRSGTVEERLARLEDSYDRNAEALEFLNKVYSSQKAQQKAQQEQAERDDPAPDAVFAVDVNADIKGGQVDGPASAPVTIVKAFDFACPFCQRVAGTMDELVKDYNGKVRVVYANMLIHPVAKPAHLASCAAGKQGKYNEFKNAFWEKGYLASRNDPSKMGEDNILAIAKDLGLDTAKLKADMASPDCEQRITNDMNEMQKFHVNSTPTFFINGKHLNGALPKERFKQIIDEQLKVAESSGVSGADYYDKVVLAKGEKQFRSKMDPKPSAN
jgi:protein-disulfide isomerase